MAKRWADLTEDQKQRMRDASARYRERNRERLNEQARDRYAVNRDAICARKRAAYESRRDEAPEEHRAKQRERYERYGREYAAAWAKANSEKAARSRRKWRSENQERARELHLLARFGLTADAYDALFAKQHGRCAICGREEWRIDKRTSRPRALAVDHCHETGRVRGLLCFSCNIAIGFLEDSPALAESASRYLRGDNQ